MENIAIKLIDASFSDLTPDHKYQILLAIIVGVVIYLVTGLVVGKKKSLKNKFKKEEQNND